MSSAVRQEVRRSIVAIWENEVGGAPPCSMSDGGVRNGEGDGSCEGEARSLAWVCVATAGEEEERRPFARRPSEPEPLAGGVPLPLSPPPLLPSASPPPAILQFAPAGLYGTTRGFGDDDALPAASEWRRRAVVSAEVERAAGRVCGAWWQGAGYMATTCVMGVAGVNTEIAAVSEVTVVLGE